MTHEVQFLSFRSPMIRNMNPFQRPLGDHTFSNNATGFEDDLSVYIAGAFRKRCSRGEDKTYHESDKQHTRGGGSND